MNFPAIHIRYADLLDFWFFDALGPVLGANTLKSTEGRLCIQSPGEHHFDMSLWLVSLEGAHISF